MRAPKSSSKRCARKTSPKTSGSTASSKDDAYRGTTFWVFYSEAYPVRVGKVCAGLDEALKRLNAASYAVITAYNPMGHDLPHWDNDGRQKELKQYLSKNNLGWLRSAGVGADPGRPPEDSVCVLAVTKAQAQRIGKMFHQESVVYGEAGRPAQLLYCNDASECVLRKEAPCQKQR
jgi:hypothetical protein